MKKNIKRICILLLVILTVFALSACTTTGYPRTTEPDGTTTIPDTNTVPNTTTVPDTTTPLNPTSYNNYNAYEYTTPPLIEQENRPVR